MDYPPRYPSTLLNTESSNTLYPMNINNIYHLHQQQHHVINNMYGVTEKNMSMQQHCACQMQADLHENMKNSSLGNNYPTKQSLSADSLIETPKKEGLFQSVFRSATNLLGEHLSRRTNSFIRSLSSMSSPLSVTVVSPDLYKSLHATGVQESKNIDSDTLFTATTTTTTTWCNGCNSSCNNKDSSDETLASVLYDDDILNGSYKIKLANGSNSASDPSDVDRRWKEYKNMYVDCNTLPKKSKNNKDQEIVNTSEMRDVGLESIEGLVVRDERDLDKSTNFGSTLFLNDDETVILEPAESDSPVQELEKIHETNSQDITTLHSSSSSSVVGAIFTNAYNKVVNGVNEFFQMRSCSPESEPSALFSKRAGGCPKPKKVHPISSGRGRGRGRAQLRRSGVSQKRHRKERSKYDRRDDIKFDIEHWEEIENYADADEDNDETSVDVCDFAGGISSIHQSLFTINFEDIKPMKQKHDRKSNLSHSSLSILASKLSLDVDEDEEYEDDDDTVEDDYDYENDNTGSEASDEEEFVQFRCANRIRLSSVSSIDSDDSFCVVFNDSNESKHSFDAEVEAHDVETEAEDEIETEIECEVENEKGKNSYINIEEWKPSKIRFNFTPTIHTIVHWRFAHKAARRGNWEQMARDRARFQRRVTEVDAVLKPVFTPAHRARIWNERFASDVLTASISST